MTKPRFDLLTELERNFRFLKNVPILPNIIDEYLKLYTLFFKPSVFNKTAHFIKTVKTWEGVSASYHRYGGLEFNINGLEIGHVHSNGLVDLHFPKAIAHLIIDKDLAEAHHVQKESGWISYYITAKTPLIGLFKLTECAYQLKAKSKTKEEVKVTIQEMEASGVIHSV